MTTNRLHTRYFVAPSDGVAEVEWKAELARAFPRWSNVTEGNAKFGLGMATVKELPVAVPIAKRRIDRQMRDRVERIMPK